MFTSEIEEDGGKKEIISESNRSGAEGVLVKRFEATVVLLLTAVSNVSTEDSPAICFFKFAPSEIYFFSWERKKKLIPTIAKKATKYTPKTIKLVCFTIL